MTKRRLYGVAAGVVVAVTVTVPLDRAQGQDGISPWRNDRMKEMAKRMEAGRGFVAAVQHLTVNDMRNLLGTVVEESGAIDSFCSQATHFMVMGSKRNSRDAFAAVGCDNRKEFLVMIPGEPGRVRPWGDQPRNPTLVTTVMAINLGATVIECDKARAEVGLSCWGPLR